MADRRNKLHEVISDDSRELEFYILIIMIFLDKGYLYTCSDIDAGYLLLSGTTKGRKMVNVVAASWHHVEINQTSFCCLFGLDAFLM